MPSMISYEFLRIKNSLGNIPLLYWIYKKYALNKRWLYLHPVHLAFGKNYSGILNKPVLPYLEMHLASHCNMYCKGCSHFSPISEVRFASLSEIERDLKRLKFLFSNIKVIRLLGGEPLIHKDIVKFLYMVRDIFKNANIYIATNGPGRN